MSARLVPPVIDPADVPVSAATNYPEPFRSRVAGRRKQRLGDAAGLKNFGVNLTVLAPGAQSALRHWHTKQDEFIYVLRGELVLVTDAGEQVLEPGMCAGFPAGKPDAHHLLNRGRQEAAYLEIGDRVEGDGVTYPDDDLAAVFTPQGWKITRKDGTPYQG